MPIPILLALAVPLSILQTTYILVRHHDGVRWGLLLRRILPLMGAGMVLGYFVFADMAPAFLRRGFGGLILVLSIRELWAKFGSKKPEAVPAKGMHPAASISAMFGAGIVHGVFATGGPLLVYALGKEGLDKHAFRSTLAGVWWVLNVALVVGFVLDGRYDATVAWQSLVLLPALPLGIVLGEWLHHRVDEDRFRTGIFFLLIAAAISLLLR